VWRGKTARRQQDGFRGEKSPASDQRIGLRRGISFRRREGNLEGGGFLRCWRSPTFPPGALHLDLGKKKKGTELTRLREGISRITGGEAENI